VYDYAQIRYPIHHGCDYLRERVLSTLSARRPAAKRPHSDSAARPEMGPPMTGGAGAKDKGYFIDTYNHGEITSRRYDAHLNNVRARVKLTSLMLCIQFSTGDEVGMSQTARSIQKSRIPFPSIEFTYGIRVAEKVNKRVEEIFGPPASDQSRTGAVL